MQKWLSPPLTKNIRYVWLITTRNTSKTLQFLRIRIQNRSNKIHKYHIISSFQICISACSNLLTFSPLRLASWSSHRLFSREFDAHMLHGSTKNIHYFNNYLLHYSSYYSDTHLSSLENISKFTSRHSFLPDDIWCTITF